MPGDPVQDAIDRGNVTSAALIRNRDALIAAMKALLLITGRMDGLEACVAGALEHVKAEHAKVKP